MNWKTFAIPIACCLAGGLITVAMWALGKRQPDGFWLCLCFGAVPGFAVGLWIGVSRFPDAFPILDVALSGVRFRALLGMIAVAGIWGYSLWHYRYTLATMHWTPTEATYVRTTRSRGPSGSTTYYEFKYRGSYRAKINEGATPAFYRTGANLTLYYDPCIQTDIP